MFYGFLMGLPLGLLIAWLFLRTREREAYEKGRREAEVMLARQRAAAEASERQLQELRDSAGKLESELELREDALKQEIAGRAAAEQKNTRIQGLENLVEELQQKELDYKAKLAGLETRLDEERKLNSEKVALLNEAQNNLSDAFKALAADALKSNNRSFIELARATLESYQQGARGDLEKRQQAINGLVKPLKESLERVDSKINGALYI